MPAMPRMSLLLGAFVLVGALAAPVAQAQPAYDSCGAVGRPQKLPEGTGKDLRVTGLCSVTKGKYNYGNVNILSGGELTFADDNIEFWTKGIVIENNGKMIAGSEAKPIVSTITIKLYGADQGTSPGARGSSVSPMPSVAFQQQRSGIRMARARSRSTARRTTTSTSMAP